MSSFIETDETVELHLSSNGVPIRITIFDHAIRKIGYGLGELKASIRPGLYKIYLSLGHNEFTEFIQVGTDGYEDHELNTKIELVTSIPLDEEGVNFLNQALPEKSIDHKTSQIVLCVRNIDQGGSNSDLPETPCVNEMLDETGEFLGLAPDNWTRAQNNQLMVWGENVEPGGYVHRWHRLPNDKARKGFSKNHLDQSIWAQEGWTTIVFLGFDAKKGRIRKSNTIIYYLPTGERFSEDLENEYNLAAAIETVLHAWKTGQNSVDESLLNLMALRKTQNPMLGLLSCHVALRSRKLKLFDTILAKTENMLPGHPDIYALKLLRKTLEGDSSKSDMDPLAWPPMIFSAYRGVVRRDQDEAGHIIATESLISDIAAFVLQQGPWTMWLTPNLESSASADISERSVRENSSHEATREEIVDLATAELESVDLREVSAKYSKKSLKRYTADKGAAAEVLVERALQARLKAGKIKSADGINLDDLDIDGTFNLVDISRQVGLPVSSVGEAIKSLSKKKAE